MAVGAMGLNLVVFGLGVFLLYTGFKWYRFGRVIRDTPTAKPGSVAAGRAELQGTARPVGDPIVAPFTGEECVYLEWTVEEREGGEWVERASDTRIEPFYLEGESGRVLVCANKHPDPEQLPWEYDSRRFTDTELDEVETFLGEFRRSQATGPGTRTNPATSDNPAQSPNPAVTSESEIDTDRAPEDRFRYVKRLLPPGTPLYVFGSLELQYGRSESGVESDSETGRFIINRSSEAQMTEGAYYLGMLAITAGLLFVLWGGAMATGQASTLLID